MSYKEDLKTAIADHLELSRRGRSVEILDVEVTWDNGWSMSSTYGDSPAYAPEFRISVQIDDGSWRVLDTAFTFTVLLKMVLGLEVE